MRLKCRRLIDRMVSDDFDVDFPREFAHHSADVVFLDVVGPFHPFDVVEVLILEDLG